MTQASAASAAGGKAPAHYSHIQLSDWRMREGCSVDACNPPTRGGEGLGFRA